MLIAVPFIILSFQSVVTVIDVMDMSAQNGCTQVYVFYEDVEFRGNLNKYLSGFFHIRSNQEHACGRGFEVYIGTFISNINNHFDFDCLKRSINKEKKREKEVY